MNASYIFYLGVQRLPVHFDHEGPCLGVHHVSPFAPTPLFRGSAARRPRDLAPRLPFVIIEGQFRGSRKWAKGDV